jgi:TPR repeat protein
MLEEGRGAPPDPAKALELYRAAAGQNFLPAQNNLGIILAEGGGGDAAMVEAYVWLALAVENGAKPTGRDIVAQKLTPAQLSEAQATLAKRRTQLGLADRSAIAEPIVAPASPPALPAAPAPLSPAPVDPRPADEGEPERLKREIARLTAAAEASAQEKKTLEEKLAAGELRLSSALMQASVAEAQAKIAAATRLADEGEREKLAQQLARFKAALAESRQQAETAAAEIARFKATPAPVPETAAPPREYPALLAQLERLTREAATLRTEKADLTLRLNELTASRGAPAGTAGATRDTRFVPLQELAAADRRIAKLIADNARLQEHVKKSVAELTELSRQLVTPEPRPDPGATRAPAAAPGAR